MDAPAFAPRAIRISMLARDAHCLDVEAVAARFGRMFFLIHAHTPGGPGLSRTAGFENVDTGDPTHPITIGIEMYALPLARRPTSTNQLVTVGRLDGNDVCLNDLTVSKFHAFLREDGERFTVVDGGSRNGTRVNATLVPKRGQGEPVPLDVGDIAVFGSVSVLVIDARGLLTLARELRPPNAPNASPR